VTGAGIDFDPNNKDLNEPLTQIKIENLTSF